VPHSAPWPLAAHARASDRASLAAMGQAAAGVAGGSEPGLLPRGYQPGDVLPAKQHAPVSSPVRLVDDDGSWPGFDAKAPPPSSSPVRDSFKGGTWLGTGGSPPPCLDSSALPPPPPAFAGPSYSRDGGSDYQRSPCALPAFPGDTDGMHSSYSGHGEGRRGVPSMPASGGPSGYGGGGYEGVAASSATKFDGLGGRLDSFASSGFGGGSAIGRDGAGMNGSRRHAMESFSTTAGPTTGGGLGGGGFERRADSRMDSFCSESGYAPSNAGTVMGGQHLGRREDPVRRMASTGTTGSGHSAASTWEEGAIVEAYSATLGMWFPARVTSINPEEEQDILTVIFYVEDEAKQKSVYRGDPMLAPLGAHTAGQLPPGFTTKASQSRAGQLVYCDATTGVRYATPELAWQTHFDRLASRPAVGCETVAAVPPRPRPTPTQSEGPRPMTLAELQASAPSCASGPPSEAPSDCHELTVSGKIALPSFGDAMGSQAAYLQYEGKPGAEVAAAAAYADPRPLPAVNTGYHAPMRGGVAPRRAPPPPRNPALQTWQEDPFSEWRR